MVLRSREPLFAWLRNETARLEGCSDLRRSATLAVFSHSRKYLADSEPLRLSFVRARIRDLSEKAKGSLTQHPRSNHHGRR
jgi:hypothetical protein